MPKGYLHSPNMTMSNLLATWKQPWNTIQPGYRFIDDALWVALSFRVRAKLIYRLIDLSSEVSLGPTFYKFKSDIENTFLIYNIEKNEPSFRFKGGSS